MKEESSDTNNLSISTSYREIKKHFWNLPSGQEREAYLRFLVYKASTLAHHTFLHITNSIVIAPGETELMGKNN